MGIALITGASSGLGLEFAKIFARDGHSLILVARRKEALEQTAASLRTEHRGIQVTVFDVDLGKPGAGQALFAKVKAQGASVDFLVNNAGFGSGGEFIAQPLAQELQMIDLNVRTLVELTQLLLPEMVKRKSGRILNVGSLVGFQPGPYMATYYATKAFVNSFSEGLHEELKGTGVTCTVLTPGPTRTDFARVSGADKARLFKAGLVASAKDVAEFGYRSMLKGRALAVPGILNKLMLQSLRLSPRCLVRKMAGILNKPS